MSRLAHSFRSKKLQAKKRKDRTFKYGTFAVIFIVLAVGGAFLTHTRFLKATEVVIEGAGIVEKTSLEKITRDELNDSYLGIFSKANVALFPRSKVEQKISTQYKSVASVSASFDGLKKVLIKVTEFEPDYLWCASSRGIQESVQQPTQGETCYYMSRDAYVFSKAPGFSDNIIFTYYGILDPRSPIGKTYMPIEEFSKINNFIEQIKQLGVAPVALVVKGEGDFELLLDGGGKIFFSNREPFLTTYENLETIIAEQVRRDTNYLSRLDYIDVRFASKAFIKMK